MNDATGSWLSRLLGRRKGPDAGTERDRLDAWMREGYEHHQKGRLPEAERLYRQILNADPRYADAAYLLGTIADGEGRSDEAASLYRDAAKAKPYEPAFLFALGNQYYRARRFEEAVQTLGQALKLRPDDVDGQNDFGMALMELARWDEGVVALEPLVASHPGLFEAHHNLGTAYRQLGRIDEAIARYRRALELRPGHLNTEQSLLFTLNYSDKCAAADIAAEHRAFGLRHARPAPLPPPEARWPRRTMCVRRSSTGPIAANSRMPRSPT
jgi:tetratricopeptide (TPR) repeat protein